MIFGTGASPYRILCVLFLLLSFGFAGMASAVFVEDRLDDPAQETRAREIAKGIRCLVCQNQSIMDSGAGLAKDLRAIVRERILAGDTDDQVQSYLVSRYGDWVLLNPPFKTRTLVLWLGPAFVFGFGALLMVRFLRRKSAPPARSSGVEPLSDAEKQNLEKLMSEDDSRRNLS